MAHPSAMQVALFAVSFGLNTSYVIREDLLSWKGLYEYQFHHNMSKCEFHCKFSGIYYYSDNKPCSIPQANTCPSRLQRYYRNN